MEGLIEFGESRSAAETLCQVFAFHGIDVRMRKVGYVVQVCVSDFAKAFPRKNLSQIVNSKEIKDYVSTLSRIQNYILPDLLEVTNGGAEGEHGTWAHQRVAIRIAQKLSTEFSIWVDEKVEELLTFGMTATQPTLEAMIDNPDLVIGLATKLKLQREENARLAAENAKNMVVIEQQAEKIKTDEPKVSYFDAFMRAAHGSKSAGIREIVKQAHIKSERKFVDWMLNKRILFRQKRDNKLQPYKDYTSCFDSIDVHDESNDWSGKQLLMNPFGKMKIVKRYHDEFPSEFYDQMNMFNN